MKRGELEKRLREAGCVLSRHGANHDKWINPATGRSSWIPRHAKEVPTGTVQSILKALINNKRFSNMKTATVIVERGNDGNFWCRVKLGDTLLTSEGATVTDAKKDLMDCYEEAKADADENGQSIQNVTFKYEYDLQAFFDFFNFLNMNEIARRANINPSLLRQYNAGIKRAGEKTYSRLATCLNEIRTELNRASLLQN